MAKLKYGHVMVVCMVLNAKSISNFFLRILADLSLNFIFNKYFQKKFTYFLLEL